MQVWDTLLAEKLDLTEAEYALLILACRGRATREQAWRLLGSISRELTVLTDQTINALELLFRYCCPQ